MRSLKSKVSVLAKYAKITIRGTKGQYYLPLSLPN